MLCVMVMLGCVLCSMLSGVLCYVLSVCVSWLVSVFVWNMLLLSNSVFGSGFFV